MQARKLGSCGWQFVPASARSFLVSLWLQGGSIHRPKSPRVYVFWHKSPFSKSMSPAVWPAVLLGGMPPQEHPCPPAATTLLNLPRATLTGDVLAHNRLFLLVLHPAGTGCDWPRAVPDLFPHRLFCSPCYPKLPVMPNTWMHPACLFCKVQLPPACRVVIQWQLFPPKFGIRALIIRMQVVSTIK